MYARQINSEESDAIREISNALNTRKPDHTYKLKQKLLGAFCVVSSIAALVITKSEASVTYTIMMIPLGTLLIVTKEKVIW